MPEQHTYDNVGESLEVEIENVGHGVEGRDRRYRSRVRTVCSLCVPHLTISNHMHIIRVTPSVLLEELNLVDG